MVGSERLELSHLAALEPKSSASTNSATTPKRDKHRCFVGAIIANFYDLTRLFLKNFDLFLFAGVFKQISLKMLDKCLIKIFI